MIHPQVDEQLQYNARIYPDSLAYLDPSRGLTWLETRERVAAAAQLLRAAGAQRGTRIALMLANSVESAIILHATWSIGATGVVINPATEFHAQIQQFTAAGASGIAYDSSHSTLALRMRDEAGVFAVGNLIGAPPGEEEKPAGDSPHDLALISFTSGTTGRPKGTAITYASLPVRGAGYAIAGGVGHKDRGLITTPMCMAGSINLAFLPYLYSAACCIMTNHTQGDALVRLIQTHGVTTMFSVPLVSRRIADAGTPEELRSLRFILSSGAELPSNLLVDLVRLGIDVHEAAGTSESAGGIYMTQVQRALKPRSVGVAMAGCTVEVRDTRTNDVLADGQSGELVIRGPIVGHGYLREGGVVDPFPWYGTRTGDLGHRDRDGFFYITGRSKDIIVTGGQNVHPIDVEEILRGIEGVREVVVIGCPDAKWGELVSAVVVPNDIEPGYEEILHFARSRLASYQVPKQVAFVNEFPYTAMGKLDRKKLRNSCDALPWRSLTGSSKPSTTRGGRAQ